MAVDPPPRHIGIVVTVTNGVTTLVAEGSLGPLPAEAVTLTGADADKAYDRILAALGARK